MERGKYSGIYQIQSKIKPDRIYVGSAVYVTERRRIHLHDLRLNKHHSGRLQNHYNKYGEEDLVFSVLCKCEKEQLIQFEQYFIDFYHPYFNICQIAGSLLGTKRSPEVREKFRQIGLARNHVPWNKGIKTGIVPWNKGKTFKQSKETCEKKSKSFKGRVPWNKGLPKELNPRTGTKLSPQALANVTAANRKMALEKRLKKQ